MKKIMIILLILFISGCSYKFTPEELIDLELHYSTDMKDWGEDIFDKNITINFNGDKQVIAQNITDVINKNKFKIGLYKRNESCQIIDAEPGIVILKYALGTIIIEEDFCNPESTTNQVYLDIMSIVENTE